MSDPVSFLLADVGPMTFTGVRFLIGSLVVAPLKWREWRALKARGLALICG